MRRTLGAVLVGWPFAGLAWALGKEFFIAFGVVAAIVASVFYGVYLLTPARR